jgi:hypothetical protein
MIRWRQPGIRLVISIDHDDIYVRVTAYERAHRQRGKLIRLLASADIPELKLTGNWIAWHANASQRAMTSQG